MPILLAALPRVQCGIIPVPDGSFLIVRADGRIVIVRSWAEIVAEARRRYPKQTEAR
jgi:hypothetical protein